MWKCIKENENSQRFRYETRKHSSCHFFRNKNKAICFISIRIFCWGISWTKKGIKGKKNTKKGLKFPRKSVWLPHFAKIAGFFATQKSDKGRKRKIENDNNSFFFFFHFWVDIQCFQSTCIFQMNFSFIEAKIARHIKMEFS